MLAAVAIVSCLALARSLPANPLAESRRQVPRALVKNPVVDLGVVAVGGDSVARFALENRGDAVLEILGAEPGCKCTLVDFDEAIPPGQVGHVRARLVTAELAGPVTQGIVVRTNDPDHGRVLLTLKAEVIGSVVLLPQPVMFLRERAGLPPAARVLIRQESSEPGTLAIEGVSTSVPWLTAGVERLDAPRPRGGGLPPGRSGDWVLEVRFRGDEPRYGPVRESVRFRTGLARQPEVVLEVESNLEPPVHLSARKLVLAPAGEGRARGTLYASVQSGLDPAALSVEAEPAGLEVKLDPATERMFRVEVGWAGERLSGASMTFRIDGHSLSIPVEWSGP
jgi:hypothetical protein